MIRKIIHIDMDCFYAAIEMRDRPELKDKPMAIGGFRGNRGVLCTANYEARKFGVGAAMPTAMAVKKCPGLILVPPNFKKYSEVSSKVFTIFKSYTDKIQGLSLDEAFLDVTECDQFGNLAVKIAKDIREKIFDLTGCSASAGISINKMIAKIASDENKPNGQFCVPPWEVNNYIPYLPVKKISGVGEVMQKKMTGLGIHTCGDLQNFSISELHHYFKGFGETLYNYARGIDHRPVKSNGQRKSLSTEYTFAEDFGGVEQLTQTLEEIYVELLARLEKHEEKSIKTIYVKIKYHNFEQTTIEEPFVDLDFSHFRKLFVKRYSQREDATRLLGLGVKFLSSETQEGQLQLF